MQKNSSCFCSAYEHRNTASHLGLWRSLSLLTSNTIVFLFFVILCSRALVRSLPNCSFEGEVAWISLWLSPWIFRAVSLILGESALPSVRVLQRPVGFSLWGWGSKSTFSQQIAYLLKKRLLSVGFLIRAPEVYSQQNFHIDLQDTEHRMQLFSCWEMHSFACKRPYVLFSCMWTSCTFTCSKMKGRKGGRKGGGNVHMKEDPGESRDSCFYAKTHAPKQLALSYPSTFL